MQMESNIVNKDKLLKTKKIKDIIRSVITYLFSSFGFIVLLALVIFVFSKGYKSLSFKMITSNYYETPYFATCKLENSSVFYLEDENDIYYSKVWGIGLKDDKDFGGNNVVKIVYIDNLSPLKNAVNLETNKTIAIKVGQIVNRIQVKDVNNNSYLSVPLDKAIGMRDFLDKGNVITELYFSTMGGGIRGSLLTTIYLILLTLVISLPIGAIAAIYLAEYAPQNKITNILRTLIDMTSGIPSIIFGLIGVIVFIPFVNKTTGSTGGSILSGALTLSIMLLPIIIRTTEEAIRTIPKSYKSASLALGASETQTTFKIILPNAIPGILTSTLLSIGRIIGESAALIFAIGTAIQDKVKISQGSTSLAVHIWSVMSNENPNYEQACAISIIILFVVLILNILVKLISKKLNRFEVK